MSNKKEEISQNLIRLFREICTFSLKHKNITEIKDSFLTSSGMFIIVSELGLMNLQKYKDEKGILTPEEISNIMI